MGLFTFDKPQGTAAGENDKGGERRDDGGEPQNDRPVNPCPPRLGITISSRSDGPIGPVRAHPPTHRNLASGAAAGVGLLPRHLEDMGDGRDRPVVHSSGP